MSRPNSFDEHAATYVETIESAIGASGEPHDYFVQLKADITRDLLGAAQPRDVLDFGCGIGLSTHALHRVFPSASVVGSDDSRESLAIAEREPTSTRLRFVNSGPDGLPFADGSFDLAFTACVFHHILPAERRRWAVEIARVVRPGGAVIVFEHNPWNPLTVRAVRNTPFDAGVVLLPASETHALLRHAGLRVRRPAFYAFFPRALASLRPAEPWMRWLPIGAQYFVLGRKVTGDHEPGARSLRDSR